MEILQQKESNYTIISLNGDLDASSAILLDTEINHIISNAEKQILVDFLNLDYIASAGVGVFLAHLDEIQSQKINMVLFGMNERVKGVFEILGLDALLQIKDTKEDALNTIN